ncbi:MAG TPA: MoxR family ATPase [Pseudonocardiaceae bacterium]|jgi:MoxR-like ATPase|nr:MoxR family ATPase [Pseudonocardiaceae bacterium]
MSHQDLRSPQVADVHAVAQRIVGNIERILVGKPDAVRTALITLLAEGHLLIEDVPGVGKTSLAKALARSVDCTVTRIQFTPDLLPSDITGVSVFNRSTGDFDFRPGPVFANVVVGDEINRASPKTQSALLECMEERQVTVDGHSYPLSGPFMVIATQNPAEMEGTYPLPEAQRDRFTARISLGYPDLAAELAMVDEHAVADPFATLEPVSTAAEVRAVCQAVRLIHVSADLRRYVVEVVSTTRRLPELRLGASPRATLQLIRASRASAALAGRDFVIPDDVQVMAQPVLSHRLVLTAQAQVDRLSPKDLVRDVLARVPVPHAPTGPLPASVDGRGVRNGARVWRRSPQVP